MSEEGNKKIFQTDDSVYDQSKRAEAVLDRILHAETEAEEESKSAAPEEAEVTVEEELAARPTLDFGTGRDRARVLFVTTNEQALETNSRFAGEYLALATLFDEIHVMVLLPRAGKNSFTRAEKNLWFYKVHAKDWQDLPRAARDAADEALTWNGTVRPDVIVGVDPFEAGASAYEIAKSFSRPLQIHVKTDFLSNDFAAAREGNYERAKLADKLLREAGSVRAGSAAVKKKLEEKYRKIADLKTLPRFYNFAGLQKAEPGFNLREKYPGFAFIMLTFGPLTADSHLHDVFTAIHRLLLNPRIGLIVIGDGPGRNLFLEKVKLLGIEKSVVFLKQADDLVSYFKTSDLFIETDVSDESEIRILQAASCGAAIAAYETDVRKDLFQDGKSAFLCPPRDMQCLGQKVNQFINTPALRTEFKELALSVASERLHEDKDAYFRAIRDSIESVLVPSASA